MLLNKIPYKYGGVAQLGEHLPCKQGVMGSNPIISTKGVNPASEMGIREIDAKQISPLSHHLHHGTKSPKERGTFRPIREMML